MPSKLKRPRWSIARKGFFFIGIFLFVQLCFLGGNGWLLEQTEFILQKENHSKQVVGHTNWLVAQISQATESAVAYAVTDNAVFLHEYEVSKTKVDKELKELLEFLEKDTSQKKEAQKLADVWDQIKVCTNRILLAKGKSAEEKISEVSAYQNQQIFLWAEAANVRHQLLIEERTRVSTSSESSTSFRNTLKGLLVLGVGISIFLALITFNQFSRRIVKRVDHLSDNAVRLESGLVLSPPIPGSDEIADLDQVFHHMATVINESKSQLEQRERQMVTMIDNMPVGLMAVNKAGTVDFSNPTAREIYASDPRGRELKTLLPISSNGSNSSVDNETKYPSQFQLKNEVTGKPLFLEVSAREIKIGDDEKMLYLLQDVTQKHELDRLKEEFVAVVSHDLRTPLSSIQLFLTMLEHLAGEQFPAELQKPLSIAKRSTTRLLNLVNDLLDFARVDAGEFSVQIKESSLLEIVTHAAQAVSGFAQKNGISIEQQVEELSFEADEERLIQVVVNLLSNAVKFSPAQGIVKISAEISDDFVEVSVKDCGRGIPPEHQSSIFEKYKQVEDADSKRGTGTGLGLPICKAIIKQHGGTIGVVSKVGEGSTFWFKVPRRQKSAETVV